MQTAGRVCSALARIFRAAMHASPPSFKHETHLHSGPHRMFAAKHTQYLLVVEMGGVDKICGQNCARIARRRTA